MGLLLWAIVGLQLATLAIIWRKCNALHSPERAAEAQSTPTPLESFDTVVCRLGQGGTELNLHVAKAPDVLTYAGVNYKRRHTLRSGVNIYDEVKG